MEGLTLDAFLSIIVPLTLYFLITLTGSFMSDIINTINKKDKKFRLGRVLVGAVFGAFIMMGLEKPLLSKISLQQVTLVAFVVGSVSFELFSRVSKLDNLIEYIKVFKEVKSQVTLPDKKLDKDSDDGDEDGEAPR